MASKNDTVTRRSGQVGGNRRSTVCSFNQLTACTDLRGIGTLCLSLRCTSPGEKTSVAEATNQRLSADKMKHYHLR